MSDSLLLAPAVTLPAAQTPALVYLAGLSAGSRRTLRGALDVMARILTAGACDALNCPWWLLRFQHTAALRAAVRDGRAPATANKYLAALRGVLRTCQQLGQMSADDCAAACALRPVSGATLLRGRALTAGELAALFGACAKDRTSAGRRDAALLAVLYGAGLRRAEAAALELADYDQVPGALVIRAGKGQKSRLAYLTGGARDALGAWLVIRGEDPGPLFYPLDKCGRRAELRPLSAAAIYRILRKRAAAAAVKLFSPHDLRRSFISDLLDAGADVVSVQGLAGHANVATTARYDRRGERAKQRAAELLHVPYTAPGQ